MSSTKEGLSAPRRHLLETIEQLRFGRIHNLEIRGGEPVFDPAPRITRDIKLGENESRSSFERRDIPRKNQIVDLFAQFDRLKDCTVETLEIRYGLPFRLIHCQPAGS